MPPSFAPPARRIVAALVLGASLAGTAAAEDRLLTEAVNFSGMIAWLGSGAPGFVIAAMRNGETAVAGFGETATGSGRQPDGDTIMRIGSISKTFCGDLMGALAGDGRLGLGDPLASHLPGWTVPEKDGRVLRLIDLVTQTSGLPREMPDQEGGTPDDPFGGNTYERSKAALARDPYLYPPGTGALYSNWGFDLLGAALTEAGGAPYAQQLAERVLTPLGMADTKFNLAPGDEARAMQGHFFDGSAMPWVPSPVTIECAGGLYTTANDMLKWLGWHLARDSDADADWRRMVHAGWRWRDGLSPVGGLDDAGQMTAMSLGWVIVAPEGNRPLILQKTGGLQGMFSYVAIAPERGVGVFTAMNKFDVGGFNVMVEAANSLIAELAPR